MSTTPVIVRRISNSANSVNNNSSTASSTNNNSNHTDTNASNSPSTPVSTRPRVMRVLSKGSAVNNNNNENTSPSISTTSSNTPSTTNDPTTNGDENSSSTNLSSSGTTPVKRVVKRLVVKKRVEGESTAVSTPQDTESTAAVSTMTATPSTTGGISSSTAVTSQQDENESSPKKSPSTNSSSQSSSNINTTSNQSISTNQVSTPNHLSEQSSVTSGSNENETSSTTTTSTRPLSTRVSELQSKFNSPSITENNSEQNQQPQKRVVRVGVNRNSGKYGNESPVTASPEVSNVNQEDTSNGGVKVRRPTAPRINTGLVNNDTSSTSDSPNSARRVQGIATMLAQNVKLMTPQQLQEQKQQLEKKQVQDRLRPMRPNEILEWYGMDASIAFTHAKDDVKFDENSSIEELKKQYPNISYTDYIYNPIFDEQIASEEVEIDMTPQEILQYNFVVDLMRKKNPNLMTLDPIVFEEEMRNASRRASLTILATKSSNSNLNNSSNQSNHTESVTSTEDVLSREEVGFPIQKCSKNWRYQLKKKKDHSAKNSFREDVASMTPRANAQLSPSSPTTTASSVNPLFDHLYYMPCWKHQIQLEQISKRLALEEIKKI
ncbi:hypothetical protein C9374_010089 [Naegleria lovaniensis]|uniref:Uncharacterized protein n=1 Tax=Naegleria lovaniensis TaxID=51637 RepID=A0AA88GGK5_NAELO|nr:uncharacterized protein C9374_010089 [Naegleria lovaniensis]KAG2375085.1 hypothetical protein C9374_010089 [Naegleria lovaniensis]